MNKQLEDGHGNRGFVDINELGIVFVLVPKKSEGRHAMPERTMVHYVRTWDAVIDGLNQLTGTVWREA